MKTSIQICFSLLLLTLKFPKMALWNNDMEKPLLVPQSSGVQSGPERPPEVEKPIASLFLSK